MNLLTILQYKNSKLRGSIYIDKHQLPAAHRPVSTPITTEEPGLFFQTPPYPKHRQKPEKTPHTSGDGGIHSSTQLPQPKAPDINHPCTYHPNSHLQTTRDSEGIVCPHPRLGLYLFYFIRSFIYLFIY